MSGDTELQAIRQLLSALEPLDSDARGRVLDSASSDSTSDRES